MIILIVANNLNYSQTRYADDKLFAASLLLLERICDQKVNMLKSLRAVLVLQSEKVQIFGDLASLSSELDIFHQLIVSYCLWGSSSSHEGGVDIAK